MPLSTSVREVRLPVLSERKTYKGERKRKSYPPNYHNGTQDTHRDAKAPGNKYSVEKVESREFCASKCTPLQDRDSVVTLGVVAMLEHRLTRVYCSDTFMNLTTLSGFIVEERRPRPPIGIPVRLRLNKVLS